MGFLNRNPLNAGDAKLTSEEQEIQAANIQGELARQAVRSQEIIPDPAALVALSRVEPDPSAGTRS